MLLAILIAFSFVSYGQTPQLSWAHNYTSQIVNSGEKITVDNSGNVIALGNFQNEIDIDPSTSEDILGGVGPGFKSYIRKMTPHGDLIWALTLEGAEVLFNSLLFITDCTTDSENSILITGRFIGVVDFDLGANQYIDTSVGENSFILKLSDQGEFMWVDVFKQVLNGTNTGYNVIRSIDVDESDNIYVSGLFNQRIHLDPANPALVDTTLSLSPTFTSDQYRGFIAKYDKNGGFLWRHMNKCHSYDEINHISCNVNGSVTYTGFFQDSIVVEDDGLNLLLDCCSIGTATNMYVVNIDSDGEPNWMDHVSGNLTKPLSMESDSQGAVYISGEFNKSINFTPGFSWTYIPVHGYETGLPNIPDGFIMKYSSFGEVEWHHTFGGKWNDVVDNIAIDELGKPYVSCYINDSLFIDEVFKFETVSNNPYAILRFESDGTFDKKLQFDSGAASFKDFNFGTSGELYATGTLSSIPTDFDPSTDGEFILSSSGAYAMRWDGVSYPLLDQVDFTVYPNPALDQIIVQYNLNGDKFEVKIYNSSGQEVYSSYSESAVTGIDITDIQSGLYFLFINDGDISLSRKLIVL